MVPSLSTSYGFPLRRNAKIARFTRLLWTKEQNRSTLKKTGPLALKKIGGQDQKILPKFRGEPSDRLLNDFFSDHRKW